MAREKRVDDDTAAETIAEMAYKHPDATNREIYDLCRSRRRTPVSLWQVATMMQVLRAERREAFAALEAPNAGTWDLRNVRED